MDHQSASNQDSLVSIRPRRQSSQSELKNSSDLPGVYIKTYGCQMNEYDTEKLKKILEDKYCSVDKPEDAELILINTCSVRDKPEQKLYSMLGQLQELKKKNPSLMIGVGGCVAQQEGETIVKRSKTVDLVFGTHNLSLVPSMLELRKNGSAPQVAVDYRDEWEDLPAGFRNVEKVSAFVSISRGCNKNCTYCIVPTTRGKEVSRHPNEVLREVRIAAHRGAKEIVLLGQTVNSYGRDLNPKMSFVDLMRKVAEVEAIKRIRFTSPHPQEVRSDFIDLVCDSPKVCKHIHMPLQAGSDRILKLMNRNYRKAKYLSIIDAIYSRVPEMSITTDIIVGFPGETESEFLETVEIMKQVEFENSYSFIFSPRPGTVAENLEDPVPYEEKLKWLQHLQKVQEEISGKRLARWVGRQDQILIDGSTSYNPNLMQGRLSQNIVVNLTNQDPSIKPGDFVTVKINRAHRYTLSAETLNSEPQKLSEKNYPLEIELR
jgi:tRNA-2-methylthio-N6-dimethylallyladenosine synthase